VRRADIIPVLPAFAVSPCAVAAHHTAPGRRPQGGALKALTSVKEHLTHEHGWMERVTEERQAEQPALVALLGSTRGVGRRAALRQRGGSPACW